MVHAGYIVVLAGYILVHAGYIPVHAGYIQVYTGYMSKCHLLTTSRPADKGRGKKGWRVTTLDGSYCTLVMLWHS